MIDVFLRFPSLLGIRNHLNRDTPKHSAIFEFQLYHVEHFIEGDYIKYNSNSGFVDNKACRQTPQAFSHFTFERSGHELIVVDIQGVGDLYTDPQIHTTSGNSENYIYTYP